MSSDNELIVLSRMHTRSLLIVRDLTSWERFVAKRRRMKLMNTNGSNSGSHSRKRHETLNLFAVNLCKWKKKLSKRFLAIVVWDKREIGPMNQVNLVYYVYFVCIT